MPEVVPILDTPKSSVGFPPAVSLSHIHPKPPGAAAPAVSPPSPAVLTQPSAGLVLSGKEDESLEHSIVSRHT